jgi:hypothetical protein
MMGRIFLSNRNQGVHENLQNQGSDNEEHQHKKEYYLHN